MRRPKPCNESPIISTHVPWTYTNYETIETQARNHNVGERVREYLRHCRKATSGGGTGYVLQALPRTALMSVRYTIELVFS